MSGVRQFHFHNKYRLSTSCIKMHIDLCALEYSFGDAPTALKRGDEAYLHIWHLTCKLSIASLNLSSVKPFMRIADR